ncbi:MAG: response regulator [Bacteroidetes bacterium]|nr:response regulator [Bacteroidota bacterium]
MKLANTTLELEPQEEKKLPVSPKIFIVEDDVFYNKVVSYSLSSDDYEVKSFTNAKDYLEGIANEKPDLVIMDYHLGDTNGTELMNRTHSLSSSIKVVMISAQEKLDEATDILKKGALAFVAKDKMIFSKLKVLALKAGLDKEAAAREKTVFIYRAILLGGLTLLFLIYLFVEFL